MKEKWSKVVFIFGAVYRKINAAKWPLLNFLLAEVQMSIHLTRRNTIKKGSLSGFSQFVSLVGARVWIDFRFHRNEKFGYLCSTVALQ